MIDTVRRRGRPPKNRTLVPQEDKPKEVEAAVEAAVEALGPIEAYINKMMELKKAKDGRFYK